MIPRGEVGLIFATIGLERGIFGDDLYAAVLLVVIASTIITPPILKMRLTKVRERAGAVMVGEARAVDEWFAVKDGRFDLVDDPPITSALEVTFEAALLGRRARPGDRLLRTARRASSSSNCSRWARPGRGVSWPSPACSSGPSPSWRMG